MKPKFSSATFRQVSEKYQNELCEDKRNSYAGMLKNNLRLFEEFNNCDVMLSSVSPTTISEFERFMKRKGSSITYTSMILSMTRTIINRAIKEQLVKYDVHPFAYWKRQADEPREIDISLEDVRKIRDSEPKLKKLKIARDIFMLSYYLCE